MRKAVIVGIDYYQGGNTLHGCVNDAVSMRSALEFNHDATRNFQCRTLLAEVMQLEDGTEIPLSAIDGEKLSASIDWLFDGGTDSSLEIALFYFSGHGSVVDDKGYLCPSDFRGKQSGVPMSDLIAAAAKSKASNKIIILDCCHSGATGVSEFSKELSDLPEDTVIMAGCTKEGYSQEKNGSGVYTQLFVEALNGAGSNVMGEVTPGSVYAYIDKSLGAFDQRPVFKANVKSFICLRKNKPLVDMAELRRLTEFFKRSDSEYPLDPSYEEDKKNLPEGTDAARNEENEAKFKILRKYWQNGLLVPCKEEYMYWAAVRSDKLKLTAMGKHYWKLLHNGVI